MVLSFSTIVLVTDFLEDVFPTIFRIILKFSNTLLFLTNYADVSYALAFAVREQRTFCLTVCGFLCIFVVRVRERSLYEATRRRGDSEIAELGRRP